MFKPIFDKMYNEEMMKYDDIDKKKYSNLYDNSNIHYNIKISSTIEQELKISIKYDISSLYLPHPLEIFSQENDNIVDIISNFHLPCVRLYYNGNNVFLLPSCITAIATGMCLDYKYISSTKSPMTIISNKKLIGFGTWINYREKKQIISYILNNTYWKTLFCNINYKNIYTQLFNPISKYSKIIKPKFYTISLNENYNNTNRYNNDYDLESDVTYDCKTFSITKEIIYRFNSVKIDINYDKFICIDGFGNILPVKPWIIEFTWNMNNDFN